jgi:hypothetical protein
MDVEGLPLVPINSIDGDTRWEYWMNHKLKNTVDVVKSDTLELGN